VIAPLFGEHRPAGRASGTPIHGKCKSRRVEILIFSPLAAKYRRVRKDRQTSGHDPQKEWPIATRPEVARPSGRDRDSRTAALSVAAQRSLVGVRLLQGAWRELVAAVKLHRKADHRARTPSRWVVKPQQRARHSRFPSMGAAIRARNPSTTTFPLLPVEALCGTGPCQLPRPTIQKRFLSFLPNRQAPRCIKNQPATTRSRIRPEHNSENPKVNGLSQRISCVVRPL
jgi:hypothetical protein